MCVIALHHIPAEEPGAQVASIYSNILTHFIGFSSLSGVYTSHSLSFSEGQRGPGSQLRQVENK